MAAHVSLWPDSLLPEDRRPSEMQAMATRVGAKVAEKILDSSHHLTRKDLSYHEPLTPKQHEMLLRKGFAIYEADSLHMTSLSEKLALRPDLETWLRYRTVVEHWDRTIGPVAKADMSQDEYTELE